MKKKNWDDLFNYAQIGLSYEKIGVNFFAKQF